MERGKRGYLSAQFPFERLIAQPRHATPRHNEFPRINLEFMHSPPSIPNRAFDSRSPEKVSKFEQTSSFDTRGSISNHDAIFRHGREVSRETLELVEGWARWWFDMKACSPLVSHIAEHDVTKFKGGSARVRGKRCDRTLKVTRSDD